MARWHWVLTFVTFTCLANAGCGGDVISPSTVNESGSGGGGQGSGQAVTIRGGERLEWDQAADSAQAVTGHTFKLFVDGNELGLSAVRCGTVRSAAGYACSGGLPSMSAGLHSLQLMAIWNGRQSSTSPTFLVNVVSGLTATE